MRKTVTKKLRKFAFSQGLDAKMMQREDHSRFWSGWKRIYRDLKKAYLVGKENG